jgi:hypothetical protein
MRGVPGRLRSDAISSQMPRQAALSYVAVAPVRNAGSDLFPWASAHDPWARRTKHHGTHQGVRAAFGRPRIIDVARRSLGANRSVVSGGPGCSRPGLVPWATA